MYDIEDGQFQLEYDQWLTVLELWSDDLSDKVQIARCHLVIHVSNQSFVSV